MEPYEADDLRRPNEHERGAGYTAPYKYPREIHFVRELPKTVSGKIRRAELRGWLRSGVPEGVKLPLET